MKKFNIILEQDGEVTVFGEWEDTPENRQCFQEWSEMGYRETTDKYVRGYDGKFYIEGQEPEKPASMQNEAIRATREQLYIQTSDKLKADYDEAVARGAENAEELKTAWLESKDKIRAENPYIVEEVSTEA